MSEHPEVNAAMARRERLRAAREAVAATLDYARKAYEEITRVESDAVDEVLSAIKAAHS